MLQNSHNSAKAQNKEVLPSNIAGSYVQDVIKVLKKNKQVTE